MDITTRQFQIIESAGKIMSSNGISSLTIKNLADEMKFSESALYRHFKSKEDIIVTMLQYLANDMNVRLDKISSSHGSAEESFKKLFESQITFFKDHSHYVTAIFADNLMDESKGINESIIKVLEVKTKHVKQIIKYGQKEGVFTTDISLEQLVHIIMGSFRLKMFKWRMDKFQFDLQIEGETLIQDLLILIKKK